MDIFSRKHLSTWAIALLVVLNIATLATLWLSLLRKPAGPPRREESEAAAGGGERARPAEGTADDVRLFLERELGLDAGQKAQFEEMRRRNAAAIQSAQAEIQRLKKAEMDAMLASPADPARQDALAAEIGAKETEKEKLLYAHLRDLSALCRPEQQKKFREIVGELLRIMAPQGRPSTGKKPREEASAESKPPHRPGERPRAERPPGDPDRRPPQNIR